MPQPQTQVSAADIKAAAARIAPWVHNTPVLHSSAINKLANARLFFKCENLQKSGAFKARGAHNAVFSLAEDDLENGVATHSSGNHGAALALAAANRGVPAHIVMPHTAPQVKQAAVAHYGGRITLCEPTMAAREQALETLLQGTHATAVHPYNQHEIIAGQATAAHEFLRSAPSLDFMLAPVGGGGLLSGTALSCHYFASDVRVYGCEPSGADDAQRSFRSGQLQSGSPPNTIADGLRGMLGDKTFSVISQYVHNIVTVDDTAIAAAMRLVWERMKLVIEPSAAVPLAVVLANPATFANHAIGIILSGGNTDFPA